ncbi:MAG: MFS transporter [Marinilabiliales bacterium]|nr:MFS transporter [Marinilabiliales bacterium]
MKRNYYMVFLVFIVFFVISFLTNILGAILPIAKDDFHASNTMAAFLPLFFFIAYGVMSIPAGLMTERLKEKKVMILAFVSAFAGAFVFGLIPKFGVMLGSLFFIGAGMAILQVAINPLLRVSGGEEHFAFNSVMAQLFFGGAAFLSPMLYSYLVSELGPQGHPSGVVRFLGSLVPANLTWVSIYWVFAIIAFAMIFIVWASRFPKVELKEDEKTGNIDTIRHLLKNKTVIMFFFGIFAYVGTEQGVANWISEFLKTYHGLRPEVEGAQAVQWYWGLMTIGCILGLGLLKLFDSKLVLRVFISAAMITLATALFSGDAKTSYYAFMTMGFCASVMWSIVFSLGMNSIAEHHGSFSGILCSGIMGGAVTPLIVGFLADHFGLRTGMLFNYVTLSYLFFLSIWAKPLIANETIFTKKAKQA